MKKVTLLRLKNVWKNPSGNLKTASMFSNRKRVKQYAKTATDTQLVKFITELVTENLTKIDQQTFVKNMNNKDAVFVRRIEFLILRRITFLTQKCLTQYFLYSLTVKCCLVPFFQVK